MGTMRTTAIGVAAAAIAAAGVLGTASAGADTAPAARTVHPQADPGNPYSPEEICGSGYSIVKDKGGIGGKAKRYVAFHGEIWGYVYLLYNPSSGKNCVVTRKTAQAVGTKTTTGAYLKVKGSDWKYDRGEYKYFAGPVKRAAADRCVMYYGKIEDERGHGAGGGRVEWGNCG